MPGVSLCRTNQLDGWNEDACDELTVSEGTTSQWCRELQGGGVFLKDNMEEVDGPSPLFQGV